MNWAMGVMLSGMAILLIAVVYAVRRKIDTAIRLLVPAIAFCLIGGIAIWIDILGGM